MVDPLPQAATIRSELDAAASALSAAGIENPRLEARLLLRHGLGLSMETLIGHPEYIVAEDQRAALVAARKALDPRGQLIIDTMNPSLDQLRHLLDGPHHEGGWELADGSVVDKWSQRKTASDPQVIETILWYDRMASDGTLTRTRSAFPLRYLHPSELALMLELSGFIEPMFYGSYDLDPFDPEAERLLVTAEVTPSLALSGVAEGEPDR